MNNQNFERIEKLFLKLSDDFSKKLEWQSAVFDDKLERQSGELRRYIGVELDQFQHKLELVIEGQQMLSEKVDRVETRLDQVEANLERRIDAVAADLSAHRKDTEAHHGVYRVKEGDE